jgi:hypothetical protein
MAFPFFTIGHSTRSLEDFVELLQQADIRHVADVRAVPRSRTNPQYNSDVLPGALSAFQIGYTHIAALGGLRGRMPGIAPTVNAFWENQSFHNYADYAMSEDFGRGLAELQELGHAQCCALMCAEVLWWRCHRRIIADYLIAAGETVFHIRSPGDIVPAQLTPAAQPGPTGSLTYPTDLEGEEAERPRPGCRPARLHLLRHGCVRPLVRTGRVFALLAWAREERSAVPQKAVAARTSDSKSARHEPR